jgi:hypothetical protein
MPKHSAMVKNLTTWLSAAVGTVFAGILIWMLLIVLVPSCSFAAHLAALFPKNAYWSPDVVPTLFRMRPKSCLPDITVNAATASAYVCADRKTVVTTTPDTTIHVQRYCYSAGFNDFRYTEDAFSFDITIDPKGIPVEELTINLHPGTITADDQHFGGMEYRSDSDLTLTKTFHNSSLTAGWSETFSSAEFSTAQHIRFTHYAVSSNSANSSNSCEAGSKATAITWSVREFGAQFEGTSPKFTTDIANWKRFADNGAAADNFSERRETAYKARRDDTLRRQRDQSDLSGWKLWPPNILNDAAADLPSARFNFCDRPETRCTILQE